jgi:hypothetical protein
MGTAHDLVRRKDLQKVYGGIAGCAECMEIFNKLVCSETGEERRNNDSRYKM